MATVPVTFSYRSSSANSIQVAGDWDSWSTRVDLNKVPNQQEDGLDLWQATHQLKPSTKFQYKFIQNGDDWHTRDDLPVETDASGNKNNVLHSPEPEHAASVDESKEKTPAEVIGAGVTSAVGAAIAGVVGINPLETDKQAIASTPGLTAGADETRQLNVAEKQSALESSAQGAPAGAAIAGANGQVSPEQLSKLSLSEGKNPADGGAAAIASAAAASTAAIPAGSSTGTSAISPKSIETVKDASATSAQPQGTLDQSGAMKGLGAGAAGDAPSVGSTKDGKASNAGPLDGIAAGAAGIGAALAGGAATAAAVLTDKSKEAAGVVQEKVNDSSNASGTTTSIDGKPASGTLPTNAAKQSDSTTISGTPATSDKDSTFSKPAAIATTAAATAATAAGGVAAAATSALKGDKEASSVGGNPTSEVDAGIKAANKSANNAAGNNDKDSKAAALGGASSAAAVGASATKSQSETVAKQEQISSGPTAAPTQNATTNPQQKSQNDDPTGAKGVAAAAVAVGAGAGAGVAATKKDHEEKPSETVAKQEQLSSGPVAASTQNPATNPQVQPDQTKESTSTKAVTPAAAAAAAGASAGVPASNHAQKDQPSETVAKQEQLSSGPIAASTQKAATNPQSQNEQAKDSSAAKIVAPAAATLAAGAGVAGATAATAQKPSETIAKQEQLSSGPVSTATGAQNSETVAKQEALSSGPASTAAGAQQSETVRKQEQLSSGPVAASTHESAAAPALTHEQANITPAQHSSTITPTVAPVAAPSAALEQEQPSRAGDVTPPRRSIPGHYDTVEYNGQETPKTVPSTPNNKADTVGTKRGGSKDGTRRKSRDIFRFGSNAEDAGEVSENGETFKTAPSSVGNTPERKTLERSRKKSFFGKLKEKLSGK